MKLSLVIFFNLLLFNVVNEPTHFSTEVNYQKTELIVGETSVKEILASKNKNWFQSEYNSYQPRETEVEAITKKLKKADFDFHIYFGTWCPDSRREVPRLVKLLDESGYNTEELYIIGVDTDKKIPGLSRKAQNKLRVQMVPTIIVYKNDKEVNRFVEFARETLEKDMAKIISEKKYKHSYKN
ncbi:MAG: TlpA family protein disulfide reductase [Bacteroidota bacterium]